jgi:hypothetical protein
MPLASTIPTAALPPVIPFTDQITAEFTASVTVAVNACGSPSKTDAVAGAIVTVIFEGGSCGEPTSPPQPRNVATRSNAGHHRDWVRVKELCPRSFVLRSIATASARVVPLWCILKKRRTGRFAARFTVCEDLCNVRAMRLMLRLDYENSRGRAESRNRCSCPRKFDRYRLGNIFRESCFKSEQSLIQRGSRAPLLRSPFGRASG